LAFSTFYTYKKEITQDGLSTNDLKTLKDLSKNPDVIITKPDKGQGVVLMNRSDYVKKKVDDILKDKTKFSQIPNKPESLIIKNEDKLNSFLRKLKKEEVINESTYSSLFTSGSRPGILYGLPKIHKANLPVRPILSALGTINYNVSKFFIPILKRLTLNQYTIQNTFTFVQKLIEIPHANDYVLASFDVTNLFTNVPLDETIDIIMNSLFEKSDKVLGFNRMYFKKLLDIATKDIMFWFNGTLYKQIEGVAMGSPLGPTLANIFMCYNESKWLENCPIEFKPKHYFRYVDDTLLLFKSEDEVNKFLEYLNNQHPNIKFTCEIEQNGHLPFLDIDISRDMNSFVSSVYRKPTYTGLTTKFNSYIPIKYKGNLISTLIFRAFKISKDYFIFIKEIDFITNILRLNMFPINFIEKNIRTTLNRLLVPVEPTLTVSKDVIYMKLPYLGTISHCLERKLSNLIKTHYSTVTLKVVYTTSLSLSNLFKFKDKVPKPLRSSIVYKFTCGSCDATYIGKTSRNLFMRIEEHKGFSFRNTNYKLTRPNKSSIRSHCEAKNHSFSSENFEILDSSPFDFDLIILESLWIWKEKPNLNEYSSSIDIELLK